MVSIDLSEKTAVVTGASQGLGLMTANLLHAAGANVVLNFFDDPDGKNGGNARAAAEGLGDRAEAIAGDVRNPDSVNSLLDQAGERFGEIDIVVNNAAILRDR
ncbi:MAG: SDR family NAD(P)-dependent oxidoreductase, partial [Verrucomicrobiales bacterium]|nr:SDR family NAD(P)-dependent oxidoreductase [Verrucomicrobiales bacterium]